MDPTVLTKMDAFALERLADFLPDKLFDAHAHLYDERFVTFKNRNKPDGPFPVFDLDEYRQHMQQFLPGRTVHANIITYPDKHMAVNKANRDAGTDTLAVFFPIQKNSLFSFDIFHIV